MTDFLQSEAWARFQERAGHEVVRFDEAHGFVHTLPLAGKYLYTPRWPENAFNTLQSTIESFLLCATGAGMGWVRVEPASEAVLKIVRERLSHPKRDSGSGTVPGQARNDRKRLVRAPHDMQPRQTFVVSVAASDDELLTAMKPKTRYNVRLAEKKGVHVFETNEERSRKAFIDLVFETAARQGIEPHPRSYYETMLESLADVGHIFVAAHEGDVLAAAYVVYHGDTAIYLHGGSADAKKNLMAPHLLHFRAMQAARGAGLRQYDFGGVFAGDPDGSEKSAWAGITRFKLGFSEGTAPREYPGCYDIILDQKRYRMYRLGSVFRASLAHIRKKLQ